MIQLTSHFTLEELYASSKAKELRIDNTPSTSIAANLRLVAAMLERIRTHLGGKPISVTSGYRCPELNSTVGSRNTSDHTKGMAADILCPSYGTPYQVAKMLADNVQELGIGQLIYECVGSKSWVHVSCVLPVKSVNRIITISDKGTVAGIKEIK